MNFNLTPKGLTKWWLVLMIITSSQQGNKDNWFAMNSRTSNLRTKYKSQICLRNFCILSKNLLGRKNCCSNSKHRCQIKKRQIFEIVQSLTRQTYQWMEFQDSRTRENRKVEIRTIGRIDKQNVEGSVAETCQIVNRS